MRIISVLNQKGGVGKTTLAIHIASGLHRLGLRTLLVDSDQQGTASDWAAAAKRSGMDAPATLRVSGPRFVDEMKQQQVDNKYDFVVVDTGGDLKAEAQRSAADLITNSALVVVPLMASLFDAWGAAPLLEGMSRRVPRPQVVIALNQTRRTTLNKQLREAMGQHGFPMLTNSLAHWEIYRSITGDGKTAFDLGPKHKARIEATNLVEEIRGCIQ